MTFKINFRINQEELINSSDLTSEVYGFLELKFGEISYGYCPEEKIPIDEGNDLLSTWLEQLVTACLILEDQERVYINDISSFNTLFLFEKEGEINLKINQLVIERKAGFGEIFTEYIPNSFPGNIKDYTIPFNNFKSEIISVANEFLSLMKLYDIYFLKTPILTRINEGLLRLR